MILYRFFPFCFRFVPMQIESPCRRSPKARYYRYNMKLTPFPLEGNCKRDLSQTQRQTKKSSCASRTRHSKARDTVPNTISKPF